MKHKFICWGIFLNAMLLCAPLLHAEKSAAPELQNPQFKDADGDGIPDAWQPYPPPTGANQKMSIDPTGGVKLTDQDAANGLGLAQWVSVTPGTKYSAKLTVTGEGSIGLHLIFTLNIPAKAAEINKIKIADVGGDFSATKQDAIVATVPENAQFMRVFIYSSKPGKCDLTVKSIEIKPADTGATDTKAVAPAPAKSASNAASTPPIAAATPEAPAPKTNFTAPETLPAGTIWTADFETGDFTQCRSLEGGKKEVVTAPEPVRNGKYAMKVMLTHDQKRTEMTGPRSEPYGEYKYGWSLYLPETFDGTSFFSIVTQWHTWGSGKDYPPDGGPPTSVSISKNTWSLKIQHQDGEAFKTAKNYFSFGSILGDKGKWTDFVMEVNWQSPKSGGGYLRLYKNGVKVVDYTGPTWFDEKTKGPFFKAGIYKGSNGWKGDESGAILYVDEVRMGDKSATMDQVDPAKQPATHGVDRPKAAALDQAEPAKQPHT